MFQENVKFESLFNLLLVEFFVNYALLLFQRRIQDSAKHLRWSVLRK